MKLQVIINPITTEKTAQRAEKGVYTFLVKKDATKIDVKHAVEMIYGEKVAKVQMDKVREKGRAIGQGKVFMKRVEMKKAIVKLKDNKKIDLFKFEKTEKGEKKAETKKKKTATK